MKCTKGREVHFQCTNKEIKRSYLNAQKFVHTYILYLSYRRFRHPIATSPFTSHCTSHCTPSVATGEQERSLDGSALIKVFLLSCHPQVQRSQHEGSSGSRGVCGCTAHWWQSCRCSSHANPNTLISIQIIGTICMR